MAIWLPEREIWTEQPRDAPYINWSHPLAKGLKFAFLPAFWIDLVSRCPATFVDGANNYKYEPFFTETGETGNFIRARKTSPIGQIECSGCTNPGIEFKQSELIEPPLTVLFDHCRRISPTNGQQRIIAQGGASAGKGWAVRAYAGATTLYLTLGNVADYAFASNIFLFREWVRVGMTWTGASAQAYQNGLPFGSAQATGTMQTPASTRSIIDCVHTGAAFVSSTGNDQGQGFRYAWNRVLSPPEMWEISNNPWQIFE